jgi:hypothetical protein
MEPSVTTQLKGDIEKSLNLLRALRDEVRVQLHLASMDAKGRWGDLEPRIDTVLQSAHEATESSRETVTEALKLIRDFLASLKKS